MGDAFKWSASHTYGNRWKSSRGQLSHLLALLACIAPLFTFFVLEKPLDTPFYRSARFDGDYAIAAQIVQAAGGQGVDSFVWPAASTAALGAMHHRFASLFSEYPEAFFSIDRVNRDKKKFYQVLEIAIHAGKVWALVGVLLLLLLSYALLFQLTKSVTLSLLAAVLLSTNLSLLSHSSWLRVEVWSLVFLAAGALAGRIGLCQPSPSRCLLGLALSGFFLSAAVFAKINVLPALAFVGLCVAISGTRHLKATVGVAVNDMRWSLFTPLLILLLCPWWVVSGLSQAELKTISGYDLAILQNLSAERWLCGIMAMLGLVFLPMICWMVGLMLQQKLIGQWAFAFGSTIGALLVGGLLALHAIAIPLSATFSLWTYHTKRMVVSVLGNIFSENPYLPAEASPAALASYWVKAGETLAHPTLGRTFGFWAGERESWSLMGSLTELFPILLLAVTLGLVVKNFLGGIPRHSMGLLFLAWGGLGLSLVNEWFSLKRGEGLDFRYYIYTTWYLITALTLALGATWLLFKSRRGYTWYVLRKATGALAGLVIVSAIISSLMWPMQLFDQKAKYGRLISTAIVNAPRLYEQAGLPGDSSEWRTGQDWIALPVEYAISQYQNNQREQLGRLLFHFEPVEGEPGAYVVRADPSWQPEDGLLWLEIPFDAEILGKNPEEIREVQMSVELDRGDSTIYGQPHAGLLLRPIANPGGEAEQHWTSLSSSWYVSPGSVEFGVEVDLDLEQTAANAVLMWQPRNCNDTFVFRNLQVGSSNWKVRGQNLSSR
jgi:hypothetical protein